MSDEQKEQKVQVTVMLPKATVEKVDHLAEVENRSRAGQVKQLVDEALDARKED